MKAIRKIIANQKEIDVAIEMNTRLIAEAEGQAFARQIQVPYPVFDTVQFNFRVHNVMDWYIENRGQLTRYTKIS
jgi:hypothetical protein